MNGAPHSVRVCEANTREAILAATREMLELLIAENDLHVDDIASAIFSTTADLNAELAAAVAEHSPPMFGPKPVKLLFATQAESDPPLIVISANHGRCLSPAYERYLLRRFRTRWNLRGVPVRLVVRGRGKGNHERP